MTKVYPPQSFGGSREYLSAVRGFSLIEVVLALGIISFALVALLGVTVVGTNAGRESKNDTDYGYVFEQVAGQLRTKPFAKAQASATENARLFPLPRLDENTTTPTTFYLDDQNFVVSAPQANKQVVIRVFDPQPLQEANAPEGSPSYPHRDHLAYVSVEISRYPVSADKSETSTYFTEVCPLQQ